MDEIVDWRQRICEMKIDGALQTEIADKMLELLEQKRASLSAFEELLFGQAITGLSINICSKYQPTDAGLESCVTAMRKILALKMETAGSKAQSANTGDSYPYGVLITIIKRLKKRIS